MRAAIAAERAKTAAAARHRFTWALVNLAARGQRPPCGTDSEPWVSENQVERLVALVLCGDCPVIDLCGDAAAA